MPNTQRKSKGRKLPARRRAIHAGDRVICIDDEGWLIAEPRSFTPRKEGIYVVREYTREFGGGAVSLLEGLEDDFYRVCRFRKISD